MSQHQAKVLLKARSTKDAVNDADFLAAFKDNIPQDNYKGEILVKATSSVSMGCNTFSQLCHTLLNICMCCAALYLVAMVPTELELDLFTDLLCIFLVVLVLVQLVKIALQATCGWR